MRIFISTILSLLLAVPGLAQQKSAKRGIGWDEKTQPITNAPIEKMLPGVSWFYNWGPAPTWGATNLGTADGMGFAPMCWNGNFNETTIRNYVKSHSGVKYLLGFNEPNFSAQANMTPESAAIRWPSVEKLAEEYGLTLVAPALNFTGEKVGGRTWSPYEWLDEFVKQYKTKYGKFPKMDCLALHCYMNWYSSNTWFATEYIYSDLYNPSKDAYGKYPNLVAFLDDFKAANGHFPRMMLTEFCAYERDGSITGVDFQIDQMTQKIQKLEQSDLVEGYAWFMGNAGGGATAFPFMSVFQTNSSSSNLSVLGLVYVHMSSFDTSKYYNIGELIQAKDYIDASTDNQQVKLRPNTDSDSELPLQADFHPGVWTKYQLDIPASGTYNVTLRMKSSADITLYFYIDGKVKSRPQIASTGGAWAEREFEADFTAGKHSIMIYNTDTEKSLNINSLKLEIPTGISEIAADKAAGDINDIYGADGVRRKVLGKGLNIIHTAKGSKKIFIK